LDMTNDTFVLENYLFIDFNKKNTTILHFDFVFFFT
jgi:hypothetical protein